MISWTQETNVKDGIHGDLEDKTSERRQIAQRESAKEGQLMDLVGTPIQGQRQRQEQRPLSARSEEKKAHLISSLVAVTRSGTARRKGDFGALGNLLGSFSLFRMSRFGHRRLA